jgi:hypothetical protein
MREPRQRMAERMRIKDVLRAIQEVDRKITALYEKGRNTGTRHLGHNRNSGKRRRLADQT